MPAEVEAQILEVDYKTVVKRLKKLGAKRLFAWRMFKIAAFYTCGADNKRFTRVRDEGAGVVTLTTKIMKNPFPDEYEIKTSDTFEDALEFVKSTNLVVKSFQQKLREKWIIPSHPEIHEIVFDIWPSLPMYLEIECEKEKDIDASIKLLELDPTKKRIANAGEIFTEYWGITKNEINDQTPSLTFSGAYNELKKYVRKNIQHFKQALKTQKEQVNSIGFNNAYNTNSRHSASKKTLSHIKQDTQRRALLTRSSRKSQRKSHSKSQKLIVQGGGGCGPDMCTIPPAI